MILKWWSCIRLCVWELRWLWRPSITPKWCWLVEPRNNVFEKVSIDLNHNNCHHHHCAVCAHQDDEWCCTEAEVLIPCFTTFSSQHLTSKLCKHSGPIKLDIILIMKDDILTTCPLKRFRKRKYELRGSISLCWKKNHLCPAEQKKVWKETGQGGLGRGKSANKDKDLNPISPMVTSTVYKARWSQKIIKEFRTRKKYNKSHHFIAGIYFSFPNQSKREDWWCALEENCTIWNGPRRYKFASKCVFSQWQFENALKS